MNEGSRAVENASKEGRDRVVLLARLGFAAKGVVYAVVGVLALQTAGGMGGKTTGTQGALHEIASQPFGRILLIVVGIGLIGYVLWRFIQAIMDPEHRGRDAKGVAYRAAYVISGLIYAALALNAFALVSGSGGGTGGEAAQEGLTAQILAQPFGRWLVGLVGIGIIGVGLIQFYRAYTAKFMNQLDQGEMGTTERKWAERSGRWGLSARGVAFAIIGYFFVNAAITYDPQEAGGLDQALRTLANQPYGPWLLGIVALGLIAYGVYCGVRARYRRIYF